MAHFVVFGSLDCVTPDFLKSIDIPLPAIPPLPPIPPPLLLDPEPKFLHPGLRPTPSGLNIGTRSSSPLQTSLFLTLSFKLDHPGLDSGVIQPPKHDGVEIEAVGRRPDTI
ncbi:hypothetical protein D9758_017820 [Tetrapyrgos nigripes]|uniref:Uncharacterized protein n=1 Tax=Tetrapyrgos nigripes TaxID=182062 RepID=A0A8H5C5B1_9AGAR|nr:hypothetical protein D9758_017820 [Tetrapyrgos nigripes]